MGSNPDEAQEGAHVAGEVVMTMFSACMFCSVFGAVVVFIFASSLFSLCPFPSANLFAGRLVGSVETLLVVPLRDPLLRIAFVPLGFRWYSYVRRLELAHDVYLLRRRRQRRVDGRGERVDPVLPPVIVRPQAATALPTEEALVAAQLIAEPTARCPVAHKGQGEQQQPCLERCMHTPPVWLFLA